MSEANERVVGGSSCRGRPLGPVLRVGIVIAAIGCGPSVSEPEDIPEHRIASCNQWCDILFAPDCHPSNTDLANRAECFEACTTLKPIWAPIEGEDRDACEDVVISYYECMDSLSCEKQTEHFELMNELSDEDLPCGIELRDRLDCTDMYGSEYLEY